VRLHAKTLPGIARNTQQEAEDRGIDARIDPGEQRRSLRQALASLPV